MMIDRMMRMRSLLLLQLLLLLQTALVVTAQEEAPNDCDEFLAGDLYFTFLSAEVPNIVVLFSFVDITPDKIPTLYLTNNAWTGTGFQATEGTLELTVPAEGILQGSNFGYGANAKYGSNWTIVEGNFVLSPLGEQVFLYCIGRTTVVPLAAISYTGSFQEPGLEAYAFNESALPERLASNGTVTLQHCDKWEYDGASRAEISKLRTSINNTQNWKGEKCTFSSATATTTWLGLLVSLVGAMWMW